MRLCSLDILRGAVMLALVVVQPVLLAADRALGLPDGLMTQLTHASWQGCHVWDWVMPFFIFMCGTALPFALPKYLKDGRPGAAFFLHLLKRAGVLWLLGMAVQGNLTDLRWERLYWYTNTLQAIAAGYVFAALLRLVPGRCFARAAPAVLILVYGLLLHFGGDYTPQGNLAIRIDRLCFPGGNGDPMYPWVLPTLMFTAITLVGGLCGDWFRAQCGGSVSGILIPLAAGTVLAGLGWALSAIVPVIKYIWTPSFVLMVLGYAVLTLTVLYAVADAAGFRRGTGLAVLYGQHALTAYLLGTLFQPVFAVLSRILLHGMPTVFGNGAQPLVLAVGNALGMTLVLYACHRLRALRAA